MSTVQRVNSKGSDPDPGEIRPAWDQRAKREQGVVAVVMVVVV